MAASTWREDLDVVKRLDDGERIGYLRPVDGEVWEPLNLLGIPLGDAVARAEALAAVHALAMPSLIEPWWCKVSRPLTEALVHARTAGVDGEWDRMVVAELTPDRALMRPMYAWPDETGCYVAVDLPADDVLFRKEPVDAV